MEVRAEGAGRLSDELRRLSEALEEQLRQALRRHMMDNLGRMASPRPIPEVARTLQELIVGALRGEPDSQAIARFGEEWGRQGMAPSTLIGAFRAARAFLREAFPQLPAAALEPLHLLEEALAERLVHARQLYLVSEHERTTRAMITALEKAQREAQTLQEILRARAEWGERLLRIEEEIRSARSREDFFRRLAEALERYLDLPCGVYAQIQEGIYQRVVAVHGELPEHLLLPEGLQGDRVEAGEWLLLREGLPGAETRGPHLRLALVASQAEARDPVIGSILPFLGRMIARGAEIVWLLEQTQAALNELNTVLGRQIARRWLTPGGQFGYFFDGARLVSITSPPPSDGPVFPIEIENQTVGFVALPGASDLSEKERRILQEITDRWSRLLWLASLFEEIRRQTFRLQTTAEIAGAIIQELDPQEVLRRSTQLIYERFGFHNVRIYQYLPESGLWMCKTCALLSGGLPQVLPLFDAFGPESTLARAHSSTEPILLQELEGLGEERALFSERTRSALVLPLYRSGRLWGLLSVEADAPWAFDEGDAQAMAIIGEVISVALQNAELYEEQRRTAERLRELDRLKTQFIANMSHELRTPLNSIIGFSRVILKGIDGPLTDAQRQDLTAIYNAGQHLLGLINDILDLSKIEAGRMELQFSEVDMREIIRGVLSTAVGLTRDKPIELCQEVPEDLPTVWADAQRARQVLLNLVSNAAKFTDRGFIAVRAWADDLFITVAVQDTGIGIPKEKQEEIFQEFTQVESGTTRRYGGTGLGLAIARRLVELMGGRIWVESEVGKGSTFFFTLPRARPRLAGEPRPGRPVILCIDDDPGVITLYRRYLEKHGFEVVGMTDPREALEMARRLRPDAITLDIRMPQKDGWTVLQELKADPQTRAIPVIICSILNERGRGFSLGAAEYLVKPFTEEELLEAIQRADGRPRPLKVLVIDDSEGDRQLIRRVLENAGGYHVLEAANGPEGVALARRERPDLVILDLMMPEMDGFAVVEALREDPSTRSLPILVLTAKALTEEDRRRLNGRIERLLQKAGADPEALLAEILEVVRRARHPLGAPAES
ncbi:MAG: response regulator [Thermoflexus sp.]|nr:response regulator [Thermoflexus sp.]